MLYDSTADVIRKALRGLAMAPSLAAEHAGLSERDVIAASRGPASADLLWRLAPALGLAPHALATLPDYSPPAHDDTWVTRLELPFGDETVNAWHFDAGGEDAVLFDTGNGAEDIIRELVRLGLSPRLHVIITHTHGDHIGGLRGLLSRGIAVSARGPGTASPLQPGDSFRIGSLDIRCISLPGHCDGALGYVVGSAGRSGACVTGDALFAGSMGGCAGGLPYRSALDSLRADVMSLDGTTMLLPGHGPASTVASEAQGNAFVGSGSRQTD